jgi:hypothetical protein
MGRLGVHKRWKKPFLIKEIEKRIIYPDDRPDLHAFDEKVVNALQSYAGCLLSADGPINAILASIDLRSQGLWLMRWAAYMLLKEQECSVDKLTVAVLYNIRAHQIWQARNISRVLQGKKPHNSLEFEDAGYCLATACAFGWQDMAKKLGHATLEMLPLGAFDDADPNLPDHYEPYRRCFAWFAVKLFADWSGESIRPPIPRHPYPSPAYDALLACWRDPDPTNLIAPLLAVCDWHTHECMYTASMRPSKRVDFISDPYMGWPIEVHMTYRLRESLGLCNPAELDHPLMKTALAPYLPAQPVPKDDLLERVIARALIEYPTLAGLL